MDWFFNFLTEAFRWAHEQLGARGVACVSIGLVGGVGLSWLHWRTRLRHAGENLSNMEKQAEVARRELENEERSLEKLEKKIWDRQLTEKLTDFLPPRAERRAVIVSFFNLKGGVGKTTVAGNLGAALVDRSPQTKVLLVDLDHQQSLSKMCLTTARWNELERKSQSTANLFQLETKDWAQELSNCLQDVAGRDGRFQIAPARSELEDHETSALVHWLIGRLSGEDIRLRLAKALSKQVMHFDYIFLDCPPRFTTGSVNALACSDFIIAPVGPDLISSDSITDLVSRLESLRHVLASFLSASPLGLILNQLDARSKVASTFFQDLISSCHPSWRGRIVPFKGHLNDYAAYDHAARNRSEGHRNFAGDIDEKTKMQLYSLADELEKTLRGQ